MNKFELLIKSYGLSGTIGPGCTVPDNRAVSLLLEGNR